MTTARPLPRPRATAAVPAPTGATCSTAGASRRPTARVRSPTSSFSVITTPTGSKPACPTPAASRFSTTARGGQGQFFIGGRHYTAGQWRRLVRRPPPLRAQRPHLDLRRPDPYQLFCAEHFGRPAPAQRQPVGMQRPGGASVRGHQRRQQGLGLHQPRGDEWAREPGQYPHAERRVPSAFLRQQLLRLRAECSRRARPLS